MCVFVVGYCSKIPCPVQCLAPYQNATRLLVDLARQSDLMVSFLYVILIDRNLVDPKCVVSIVQVPVQLGT